MFEEFISHKISDIKFKSVVRYYLKNKKCIMYLGSVKKITFIKIDCFCIMIIWKFSRQYFTIKLLVLNITTLKHKKAEITSEHSDC